VSDQHTIYIAGIDFERDAWQGHAIRGLRAVWRVLQPDDVRGYREARDTIGEFADNRYTALLIGTHANIDTVGDAVLQGGELSEQVLSFAIDLDDLKLGEPPEEVPDGTDEDDEDLLSDVFSVAAYKTALVHLAYARGNPTLAYYRTFSMEKATEDGSLWEEVRAVLASAFTHDGESGPDGPPIVLVQ
jgi:hypothetical protein